jgi:sporulation protein YpjB
MKTALGGLEMGRWLISGAVALIIIFQAFSIEANTERVTWTKLNELSDTIFQLTRQSRYDDAERVLTFFEKQFDELEEMENIPTEQARQIDLNYRTAIEAISNEEASYDEKARAATQLRLLLDSVSSKYEPLWLSFEEPVFQSLKKMKSEIEKGEDSRFRQSWNDFLSLYGMIYPSMNVSVPTGALKEVDRHIDAIGLSQFSEMTTSTKLEQMTILENDLIDVFENNKSNSDPSLFWVMLITGSTIILSLTYVAFRKYMAEKKASKKEKIQKPDK